MTYSSPANGPGGLQLIEQMFLDLPKRSDLSSLLHRVLDEAIKVAGADKGTLQRLDEKSGCLKIVASRGFAAEFLKYFETVHPHSNTTCAAALMRRMRVVVDDVSTSYLFVGTPELDIMRSVNVAAAHSTPIISRSGRLWGVVTTHFHHMQAPDRYNPTLLDRLAVNLADHFER
jgi:GAF domain-containing protein